MARVDSLPVLLEEKMLFLRGGVCERDLERRLEAKIPLLRVGDDWEPLELEEEVDLDLSKGILNYKTNKNWLYLCW